MPHKGDQRGAASTKAIKKEVQAKGLGVPQSTGQAHGDELFREAPSIGDAPKSPGINMEDVKNLNSAGTESQVGAAGATGTIEVAGGAPTAKVPF